MVHIEEFWNASSGTKNENSSYTISCLDCWHLFTKAVDMFLMKLYHCTLCVTVTVDMPGYKTKCACVLLKNAAVSVDFVIDPKEEDLSSDDNQVCSCDGTRRFEVVWYSFYVLMVIILGFLCFLLRRRILRRKHRPWIPGNKKTSPVWFVEKTLQSYFLKESFFFMSNYFS